MAVLLVVTAPKAKFVQQESVKLDICLVHVEDQQVLLFSTKGVLVLSFVMKTQTVCSQ